MSSKIQHKLYNYEQTPPESVWSRIVSGLDAKEDAGAKLYNTEITPPADIWQKIEQALGENTATKQRRIIPFFKYAAAAVLIGLVTWAGLQLINKNKRDTEVAVAVTDPPTAPQVITVKKDTTDEARNDAALEESKNTVAKLDVPKKKKISSALHYSGYTNSDLEAIPDADKIADRYIVLMTPDGNFIRMSKKLSNMVCCVSGEEQDPDCKDQVERWRKQLACSSASHPGNFLDILDLVSSLQD